MCSCSSFPFGRLSSCAVSPAPCLGLAGLMPSFWWSWLIGLPGFWQLVYRSSWPWDLLVFGRRRGCNLWKEVAHAWDRHPWTSAHRNSEEVLCQGWSCSCCLLPILIVAIIQLLQISAGSANSSWADLCLLVVSSNTARTQPSLEFSVHMALCSNHCITHSFRGYSPCLFHVWYGNSGSDRRYYIQSSLTYFVSFLVWILWTKMCSCSTLVNYYLEIALHRKLSFLLENCLLGFLHGQWITSISVRLEWLSGSDACCHREYYRHESCHLKHKFLSECSPTCRIYPSWYCFWLWDFSTYRFEPCPLFDLMGWLISCQYLQLLRPFPWALPQLLRYLLAHSFPRPESHADKFSFGSSSGFSFSENLHLSMLAYN